MRAARTQRCAGESELDAGLEHLKIIYKTAHLKERTRKGEVAQKDLADVLQDYINTVGWKDEVTATGTKVGALARRMGDLVARINGTELSVVIESKMDKSVSVGDPVDLDERGKKSVSAEESAYGQNLTALVNAK